MKTVIAAFLAAVSVGSAASNAGDALTAVLNAVGNDCENVGIVEVDASNAFVLGLDEDDFDNILSAVATVEASADGSAKALVVASGKSDAKKIYEKMWKNYEFPACDNADKIIFLRYGDVVAFFKGTSANVDAYARAFGDVYGAEAMKILKNPAKN